MLNLSDAVKYSQEQEDYINSELKQLGKDGWDKSDKMTKSIKNTISIQTLKFQNCRCAYCEDILQEGGVQIEHIAPKSIHGEYCFEPKNLVSACSVCNSTIKKGFKDTIVPPKKEIYDDNIFSIVHPYLDNPNDHIKYNDEERTIFDLNKCTQKGIETINTFNWDSLNAFIKRVLNAKSKDIPIEITTLINEISTYK